MRILVVDDHRNTREALAMALGLLGLAVETAASGPEALALLARRPCDWVVCDVRMPGIDGVELATRIRAATPRVRLLLMTAYDVTSDERTRIAALGAELLIKPVTAELLAERCAAADPHRG